MNASSSMPTPLSDPDLSNILAVLAAEDGVFLETTRFFGEEHRSLLFRNPLGQLTCRVGDDPAAFLAQIEAALADGHHLAGWLAYEFGTLLEPVLARRLTLPGGTLLGWMGIFTEPHLYDHRSGSFGGAGSWPKPATPTVTSRGQAMDLAPSTQREAYLAAIDRIKEYIAAGDTYQVNYTFKLLFRLAGSPEALYRSLRRNQSVCYGAYIRHGDHRVLSFSPELFFKKQGDLCSVRPMKGTIRRGRFWAEDSALAEQLRHDPKNRSENVMIVDLLRNDLGRICIPGTVHTKSLFDVETYETLHQMTSTIEGRLPAGTGVGALLRALFPCGSVTGAPKIRTMEIISELEAAPRGVYTGAIGWLSPDGDAVFNVPIRTVELHGDRGEMGVGSGVVFDSQPEQEWEECLLKGRFLTEPAPAFQLIETMLWQPEAGYLLLNEHLERLAGSARHLLFPLDRAAIEARLDALARDFAQNCQRVRLTLAKDGAISLNATPCEAPAGVLNPERNPLPAVSFSSQATDPDWPWLYHKTTRRELYDSERQRATETGLYEVIFANTRGEATEGTITNLFVERDGVLLTPPVSCGLLAGVLRHHLLAGMAPGLTAREAVLTRQEVEAADSLYVGNSVRGLVRVRLR
ncbi:MAG: aminodeoxychorismate synthase component I [Thermodesulfobacteriota bacterium]